MNYNRFLIFSLLTIFAASSALAGLWDKGQSDLGKATVEVAFSPDKGATELVLKAIDGARKSIRVAAYTFTSRPIERALLAAYSRGIDVKVVVDKSEAKESYSSIGVLSRGGIPVRIDYEYAIMHDKFIIIDNMDVETGSFNFTSAAEHKNAENALLLHNVPELAEQFNKQWQGLWNESEEVRHHY